jgi:hypothetical protein
MKLDINSTRFFKAIEESFMNKFLSKVNFTKFVFDEKLSIENAPSIGNSKGYRQFVKLPNDKDLLLTLSDSNIEWCVNSRDSHDFRNKGFVNLFSLYNEKGFEDSHLQLSERINSYLRNQAEKQKVKFLTVSERDIKSCDHFIPDKILISDKIFLLSRYSHYYAFSGEIVARIQQYKSGNDYLEIPFLISYIGDYDERFRQQFVFVPDPELKCYSGVELFQKSNVSTIIICDDYFLSENLNNIIQDSRDNEFKSKCLSTSVSYIFDSYKNSICNDFYYKELVYIPNGSKNSFLKFTEIYKHFKEKSNIRIYKSSVFIDDGSSVEFNFDDNDFFNLFVSKNAKLVDEIDATFIKKICTDSADIDEFDQWAKNVGIIQDKTVFADDELPDATAFMQGFDPSLIQNEEQLYWDKFFEPQNTTLVFGGSSSGKTYFILTLTYLLSLGRGSFGLQALKKYKVLYIDGETPQNYFQSMMHSLAFEINPVKITYSDRFHPKSYKRSKNESIWDFSDPDFVSNIDNLIAKNSFNIVVIDNLNCLARKFSVSSNKWDRFKKWIDETQKKYSVAFILAHHTNSLGEISGLKKIESSSNNIIQVIRRDSLFKNIEVNVGDSKKLDIVEKSKKGGCIFGLNFYKCHAYPSLSNDKSIYYRSHRIGVADSKWVKLFPENENKKDLFQECIENNNLKLEDKILCFAKKFRHFKANQLEECFGVSRSTILKSLKLLKYKGIHCIKSGRTTCYQYRFNDDE